MESVLKQWRKLAPPILSTSHCEFNGIHLCTHARKTISLAPIHSFTRQIVPSLYQQSSTCFLRSIILLFCRRPINSLLPSITFLRVHSFFFVYILYFHFHRTHFCGLAGAPKVSLFVHSFVCAITHLFLNGFQPNFYQHFSHVCPTCHIIFNL